MSTDKLQAVGNTVAEVLSEPPSPHTYFDKDPAEVEQAREQVATASNNVGSGPEISKENFGRLNSRKFGLAPNAIRDTRIGRDTGNESVAIARQAVADQIPVVAQDEAGIQQCSVLLHEAASARSDLRTTSINKSGTPDAGNRISPGGGALRGFAAILLAAGIAVAAATWLGSSRDVAKTAASQSAPLQRTPAHQESPAQTAQSAAVSPELTPLLQSMARDLASMGKEIEQLKAGREQVSRDNASLSEQLKANQEQITRVVAQLSEQLKAGQEKWARESANTAEQVRTIQEQLVRVIPRVSRQNAPQRLATAPPRPTDPAARPPVPPVRPTAHKPTPLSSPKATAQPKAEKPKSPPG